MVGRVCKYSAACERRGDQTNHVSLVWMKEISSERRATDEKKLRVLLKAWVGEGPCPNLKAAASRTHPTGGRKKVLALRDATRD